MEFTELGRLLAVSAYSMQSFSKSSLSAKTLRLCVSASLRENETGIGMFS